MKKQNLFLITDLFPYGNGECFILPELEGLMDRYRITLITEKNDLPISNAVSKETIKSLKIIRIDDTIQKKDCLLFIKYFFSDPNVREEIKLILKERKNCIKRLKQSVFHFCKAVKLKSILKDILKSDSIIYSYWANTKLTACLLLKEEISNSLFITRLHGYDLYSERTNCNWQSFRQFQDKNVDKVFFASQYGMNYYLDHYAQDKEEKKYYLARLGTKDNGVQKCDKKTEFELLSCSNIIPLKRVSTIVLALSKIENIQINWTHIGDGISIPEVLKLSAELLEPKDNICYCFLGELSNNQVHNYYQNHYVDLFLSTSSTEGGCPVSMQEALSYGVPIMGTSIGGITEMIADSRFLLKEDIKADELANQLVRVIEILAFENLEVRNLARIQWELLFDATNNRMNFMKEIKEND